jgi:CRISPR-associated protein Cmr6
MAGIPLYAETRIPRCFPADAGGHPGLWFERFFNQYGADFSLDSSEAKTNFLKTLCDPQRGMLRVGVPDALRAAWVRQKNMLEHCSGRQWVFSSDWHFVTGLGNAHPVENALLFHPTLGVPYLPGSSVKGLVRAWIELHLPEPEAALKRIFGSASKDPAGSENSFEAGEIMFFDALPIEPVELVIDTMTPHMGQWYEQGAKAPGTKETLPADWHDPVPVPFLAVKRVSLVFSVAPRAQRDDTDELLALIYQVLESALLHAGAGAKTAAGYGSFNACSTAAASLVETWTLDIESAREEHQQRAELQAMSLGQQILAGLEADMQKPQMQNPSSGGVFHNALFDQIRSAATEWSTEDFTALLELAHGFFKQHGSKAKRKEFNQLKRELVGE